MPCHGLALTRGDVGAERARVRQVATHGGVSDREDEQYADCDDESHGRAAPVRADDERDHTDDARQRRSERQNGQGKFDDAHLPWSDAQCAVCSDNVSLAERRRRPMRRDVADVAAYLAAAAAVRYACPHVSASRGCAVAGASSHANDHRSDRNSSAIPTTTGRTCSAMNSAVSSRRRSADHPR